MHLLGANFCMTYLFSFSKLRLNANPVLVCFLFWFPGASRALIFGQHGHLDNFRAVNKYFKQRGLRPRQTRNTVNNVTAFPCFFFFFGLFCFVFLSHSNLSWRSVVILQGKNRADNKKKIREGRQNFLPIKAASRATKAMLFEKQKRLQTAFREKLNSFFISQKELTWCWLT